jgi:hypothetical protein
MPLPALRTGEPPQLPQRCDEHVDGLRRLGQQLAVAANGVVALAEGGGA